MLRGNISGRRAYWKLSAIILLSSFLPGSLRAQAPPPSPPVAEESAPAPQKLPPEALNELLAPIALYPDALIALILPASTVPADLVLAARYIASNGDSAQVADQPWDESVKSLINYPEIIKWLDQNLEWTTQVGEVFLDQPADVMNSIQQLRAQAIAAGNLVDTPQQKIVKEVVNEETCVRIVPAEPEVIYVPQYDPEVVYVQPYTPDFGPVLTFGVGFAVGSWLNYDCDWGRRTVCVGDWRPGWDRDRDWDRGDRDRDWGRWDRGQNNNTVNVVNINNNTARVWQPSARIQRQHAQRQRYHTVTASNEYARAERRGGGGRRFGAVVKPSRPQFSGRPGDRDRQAWRGENSKLSPSARTARGQIRKPASNAPAVSPRTQRWRHQAARSGQGNVPREWKEKGQGQRGYQSRGMVRQNPETPSIKQPASQSNQGQARKWRSDSSPVKTDPPSSVNVDQPPSEWSTPSYSKPNDSRQQFRAKAFDTSGSPSPSYSKAKKSSQAARVARSQPRSQRSAASYSRPNKPSQAARVERSKGGSQRSSASYSRPNRPSQAARVERPKGGSQRSSASYSRPNRPSQAARVERSKGGSQRSSASYSRPNRPSQAARVERPKGGSQRASASYSRPNKPSQAARVERSQGRSQRSAPSYSKPNRPQPGAATGRKGGGGQKSGKKGDKGND